MNIAKSNIGVPISDLLVKTTWNVSKKLIETLELVPYDNENALLGIIIEGEDGKFYDLCKILEKLFSNPADKHN